MISIPYINTIIKPLPAIITIATSLTSIICIMLWNKKQSRAVVAFICTLAGTVAIVSSLICAIVSVLSLQSDYRLCGIWVRSALILCVPAIINFAFSLIAGIDVARAKFRTGTETDIDELDSCLMLQNIMPIQRKNQRIYMKIRKQNRKQRSLAKDRMEEYVHITLTEELLVQLQTIYATTDRDSIPRILADICWAEAQRNNPGLNWESPTIPMTKAVYEDVKTLYNELSRFEKL